MSECICPYCDKEMEEPDDSYDPAELYEKQCPHCLKIFVFEVDYIKTYNSSKADCLNGGEHDFKNTHTFPKKYTRLRCTMCGYEKLLNKVEEKI